MSYNVNGNGYLCATRHPTQYSPSRYSAEEGALVLFLLFLFLLTDYVEGGMYVKGIFSHHQQSGQWLQWNCYEEMRGT